MQEIFLVEYNNYDEHDICSAHSNRKNAEEWIKSKILESKEFQFISENGYSITPIVVDETFKKNENSKFVNSWEISIDRNRINPLHEWRVSQDKRVIDDDSEFKVIPTNAEIIVASFVSREHAIAKAKEVCIEMLKEKLDQIN